jgi:crotonobetainyl-CoA:carnitine CoA-transferase CaiB-like acyl-CoA transferase
MGATVVKVERPGGELLREHGPPVGDTSSHFAFLNRNKEYLTLDLQSEAGAAVLTDLASEVDFLLENLKHGTMELFGLGYDDLRAHNEDLIYCSITGFGSGSPYEYLPAFDLVVQAMSGAMSMNGWADSPPVRSAIPIGDISASTCAVQGILQALYARDVSGESGTHVEVAMLNCLLSWLTTRAANTFISDDQYSRQGNDHPTTPRTACSRRRTLTSPSPSRRTASGHDCVGRWTGPI